MTTNFKSNKNETVQDLKAINTLILPVSRGKPSQKKPGQLFFNAGNGAFYGATKLGWQAFKTTPDTLSQVLAVSGNAAGKSIVGVGLFTANVLKVTNLNSPASSIGTIAVNNNSSIAANCVSGTITSVTLNVTTLYGNTLYVNTSSIGNVSTNNLNVANLYTGTLTASNVVGSSLSTNNLYTNSITTTNFVWTTGTVTLDVLTATLVLAEYFLVNSITFGTLSVSGLATANLFNTSTLNVSEELYVWESLVNIENLSATSVVSSSATCSTFTSNLLVSEISTVTVATGSTWVCQQFTASNLSATTVQASGIVANNTSASIATVPNLYLNNRNVSVSGTLNVSNLNLMLTAITTGTFSSSTIITNTIQAGLLQGNLFSSVVSASIASISTLTGGTVSATFVTGGTLTATTVYMNNNSIYATNFSANGITTATFSGATLQVNTLVSGVLTATITNFPVANVQTLTASIITATIANANYLHVYNGAVASGTITVENVLATSVYSMDDLETNVFTGTVVTCSTLNVKNVVANVLTASLVKNSYYIPIAGGTTFTVSPPVRNVFVDNITAATVSGSNFSGVFNGAFTGTFTPTPTKFERIGYTTTSTISSTIVTTMVDTAEKGKANWGARIATADVDQGRRIAINDFGDIVVSGLYTTLQVQVYNGGTTIQTTAFTMLNSGDSDAFIVKYNSSGIASWGARLATPNPDSGYAIDINNSGDIVTSGFYTGSPLVVYNGGTTIQTTAFTMPNSGDSDAFVVKYNSSGIANWAARIAGANIDSSNGISINNSGDIVVTGSYNSSPLVVYNGGATLQTTAFTMPNSGDYDTFIVKYNSSGVASWGARLASRNSDGGTSIGINDSGDIIVTGYYISLPLVVYNGGTTLQSFTAFTMPNSGDYDTFIVKYNSSGIASWGARLASPSVDIGYGIAINNSGDIVVTGSYNSSPLVVYNGGTALQTTAFTMPISPAKQNAFIVKYNSSGVASWGARLETNSVSTYAQGQSIALNEYGDIVVTGSYSNPVVVYNGGTTLQTSTAFTLPYGSSVASFIVKYNSFGTAKWGSYLTANGAFGFGISINKRGDICVTGLYQNNNIVIYNGGTTIQSISFTMPTSGSSDAFIVKYGDEQLTAALPNPTTQGQRKTILSTGPQLTVVPEGTVNNLSQNLFLTNGESAELIWDANQNNWTVLSTTGDLV